MAITPAEAEKLRSIRSGVANVLSVYLPVPSDPVELLGLPALTGDLIDAAVTAGHQAGAAGFLSETGRDDVHRQVEDHGEEWLGQTAAIFACGQLGLLEAIPLPGRVPGCAHHYRRSRSALAAAGATVLDPSGRPVSPQREIWVGLPE
jgi:hypothetical protein